MAPPITFKKKVIKPPAIQPKAKNFKRHESYTTPQIAQIKNSTQNR